MKTWSLTKDPTWVLEQEGFAPSEEREMESLFSIGNGYLGVRGSPDILIPASQPDLFIAGIFGGIATHNTNRSAKSHASEIVPFPFPFRLEILLDGSPLELIGPDLIRHSRHLDMHQMLYFENFEFIDRDGRRLDVKTLRCASLNDPHLLLQSVELSSQNFSGELEVNLSLQPRDLEAEHPHLKQIHIAIPESLADLSLYQTAESDIQCCFASRIFIDGIEKSEVANKLRLHPQKTAVVRKNVSVFTDNHKEQVIAKALAHAAQGAWGGFDSALRSHTDRSIQFWQMADIRFDNRPELTHAQRFNLYHLYIPTRYGAESSRTSIGARALTGRAYKGHVFWDTEIFMFPFYLCTQPEVAKDLLLYRYATLASAKERAKDMGYSGACYAWESALTGEDVTPHSVLLKGTAKEIPIFTGTRQIHVTADVAYAVWRYWDATLDREFLAHAGGEILIETARFWATRVTQEGSLFHIRNVIGPDEYHSDVNNNAYTNWMARFNLKKATWVVQWLRNEAREQWSTLVERLRFRDEELQRWNEIALGMAFPRTTDEGVIEQFDGFFDLNAPEARDNAPVGASISRLLDWDRINHLRIVKQADVLMLPFLFPESFSADAVAANFSYYAPITDHGSSLSFSIHAAIAARARLMNEAEEYWEKSLYFDLKNTMHNTQLGIHPACIGGTWQALIFHMLDIHLSTAGIAVPETHWIPDNCSGVTFSLIYRGKRHRLTLGPRRKAAA